MADQLHTLVERRQLTLPEKTMKNVELIPDINEGALSESAPTPQYTRDLRVTKHDCLNDCVLDS
jgi:hypothetical protein